MFVPLIPACLYPRTRHAARRCRPRQGPSNHRRPFKPSNRRSTRILKIYLKTRRRRRPFRRRLIRSRNQYPRHSPSASPETKTGRADDVSVARGPMAFVIALVKPCFGCKHQTPQLSEVTCKHVCTRVCTHVYAHVYALVCTCVYMPVGTQVCTHPCTLPYTPPYTSL